MTDQQNSRQLERYSFLLEFSKTAARPVELDDLLMKVTQAAKQLCDCEKAMIFLNDGLQQRLTLSTTSDESDLEKLRGMEIPASSFAGWVVRQREPLIQRQAQSDPRVNHDLENRFSSTFRSIAAVPMIANKRVLGVLEGINSRAGEFSLEDIDFLSALANLTSIAIENLRLFHQSDLVSELVHELRTPLGSISAVAYLLEQPAVSTEQRSELVNTIRQESLRLNTLATNYLDFARLETGRFEFQFNEMDLNDLLRDCANLINAQVRENKLQLDVHLQEGPLTVEADLNRLKQVGVNLLNNAIKYNRRGGSITLTSGGDAHEAWFSVADHGIGICVEDQSHLFERFYRPQNSELPGTGLGLSICKRIIDEHRGKIEVSSHQGYGSVFTVRLPRKHNH